MWFFREGTNQAKEGKGARQGEERRRRETAGAVHWQKPERQADPLSQRADWSLSLTNKQHDNQTNAAQETASTVGIKQPWHMIKHSAARRST